MQRFLWVFIALNLAFSASAQQAWTRQKGHFYAQMGASYLQYNSLLNGNDDLIPLGRDVKDLTIQTYSEYGITDRLMVSGVVPLKYVSTGNSSSSVVQPGSKTAFSNIQTALTWNFWRKSNWLMSGKVNIGLPTASYDAQTGIRTGFDATSLSGSALVGYGGQHFFSSAEAGYVYRTNNYSARWLLNAQIGKWLGSKQHWIGILGLEIMDSLQSNGFDDGTASLTGLYLDQQSFLSPNLKFGYKPNPHLIFWLAAGGGVSSLTHSVAAAPGLSFTVSFQQ